MVVVVPIAEIAKRHQLKIFFSRQGDAGESGRAGVQLPSIYVIESLRPPHRSDCTACLQTEVRYNHLAIFGIFVSNTFVSPFTVIKFIEIKTTKFFIEIFHRKGTTPPPPYDSPPPYHVAVVTAAQLPEVLVSDPVLI